MAFFPYITSISDFNLLLLLKEIIAAKSLHGSPYPSEILPSLTASNSLTDHGDYQYALSQYLRHVKSPGRRLDSSMSIPCTCLSDLDSFPDMSKFTSDEHASLVIRIIQCIAARCPTMIGQRERNQTLDSVSAG